MIDKITENQRKLKELEKFGEKYYEMFGMILMSGKTIQQAIDECHYQLIGKSSIASLIEEMKKPFKRKDTL